MGTRSTPTRAVAADEAALRKIALAYPGAVEEHPWGENAFKVNGKVFLFLSAGEDGLGLSVKLPHTSTMALSLSFAQPTGYGLGKSGWVSATFASRERAPVPLLREWIDESYRAIAPKKLVAALDAPPPVASPKKARPKPRATKAPRARR